jgi:hypothetical protein
MSGLSLRLRLPPHPLQRQKTTLSGSVAQSTSSVRQAFSRGSARCVQLADTEICGAVTALTSRLQEQGAKFLE